MTDINLETELGAELITAISGIRRALRVHVGRAGGVADLTEAQRELVRVVHRRPRIRVGEAAAEMHLAPNTVSTLVGALCSSGWLRRQIDPDDARSVSLLLTPDAETRVAAWRDRRLTVLSEALAGLSDLDRTAIERATPALLRVVAMLEERP